jgi:hypothetical protein
MNTNEADKPGLPTNDANDFLFRDFSFASIRVIRGLLSSSFFRHSTFVLRH